MWKVTLRSISAHFGRFLLSVLAVSLGVAFLSGTLSFRDVMNSTFSSLVNATVGDEVVVMGPESSSSMMSAAPLTPEQVDTVVQSPLVDEAYPVYEGMAILITEDGTPANVYGAPPLGFNYAYGLSNSTEDAGNIISGEAPERGEIFLEESTATRAGVTTGDTITVYIDEPVTMTISGVGRMDSAMAGASVALFNDDEAFELFGPNAMQVVVTTAGDLTTDELVTQLSAALGDGYTVTTGAEIRAEIMDAVDSILEMVNIFLLTFVAIALAISVFIIANTFAISVRQRQREFALLMALGAAPGQVFGAVVVQAIVVGLVGSLLGLLFGQGLVILIRMGLEGMGMPLGGSAMMTASTATVSLVIGMIVTLIAVIAPSRHAASTPPIEAMREPAGATEKPLRRRAILAAVVVAFGAIATALGAVNVDTGIFGVGALLLFLGVIIAMPTLVRPAVAVLGWPVRFISPATGTLASRSLASAPRKTATTAVALAIGVALVSAGATIAASVKTSADDSIAEQMNIDLVAAPTVDMLSTNATAAEAIAQVDGVANVDNSGFVGMVALGGDDAPPPDPDAAPMTGMGTGVIMLGTSSAHRFDVFGVDFLEGDAGVLDNGLAVADVNAAEEFGWSVGDDITLMGASGIQNVQIGAISESENVVVTMGELIVPRGVFDALAPEPVLTSMIVIDLDDGVNVLEMKNSIQDALADEYIWRVMDTDDLRGVASQQVDSVLTFLYALLGLSVVIAILGIVNTLSLSVSGRTREIGLLRAVGLSKTGTARQIVEESVIMTALGAVVGLALGIGLGLGLTRLLADDSDVLYVIPWPTIAAMLVIALIAGMIAAVLPAWRAARMDVLDAIAEE